MSLLGLPGELFEYIIRDLVSVAGMRAAWKFRMTCRTFAQQISFEILDRSPLTALDSAELADIIENNLGRLLHNRLKKSSNVDRLLLDKLQQMSDFVIQAVRPATKSEGQELSRRLCDAAGACIGREFVFALLGRPPPMFSGDLKTRIACLRAPLSLAQNITAAIAVGDQDLVRNLLPGLLKSGHWYSLLFSSPLAFAIGQSTPDIVRIVLDCMSNYGGHGLVPLSDALTSDNYFQTWSNTSAMEYALYANRAQAFRVIEEFLKKHQMPISKTTFNDLLSLAIRLRQPESVAAILHLKVSNRGAATVNHLKQAASSRNPDIMRAVTMSPGMGVNKIYTDTSPLVAAVRSGDVHMVRAVLKLGADVNLRIGHTHEGKTPVEAALETCKEAITQTLLDSGADIPPRVNWPSLLKVNDKRSDGIRQTLENELRHRSWCRVKGRA